MPAPKSIFDTINRVQTTQNMIRPQLHSMLKKWVLPPGDPIVQIIGTGFPTYFDYWRHTYDDRFFDMATFGRLGSALEFAFRDYYMHQKGHANLIALKADPAIKGSVFQRIKPVTGTNTNLQTLYQTELQINLEAIPKFSDVKECFIHRHLYVHNSGAVDDQYIQDLKTVTGQDLSAAFAHLGYPAQDCLYFDPLNKLSQFIQSARSTFSALP